MQILNNKKILFIAPEFYDYPKRIKNEMENLGAIVYFVPDQQYDLLDDFLKYFSIYFRGKYSNKILLKNILKISLSIDYVFIIRGGLLSSNVMLFIRENFYKATFISYQWDSMLSNPNFLKIKNYFSKIYSFDRKDSVKYGFLYLPLFFSNRISSLNCIQKNKFDFVFVGNDHGDRYLILEKIFKQVSSKYITYFYLTTSKLGYLIRMFNKNKYPNIKLNKFKFSTLSYEKVMEILNETKCVIDINSSSQEGLTIRTFEALTLNKKLITTNNNIVLEEFYNEKNILVINRENPYIPNDFILSKVQSYNMEKYSITNWLKRMFE